MTEKTIKYEDYEFLLACLPSNNTTVTEFSYALKRTQHFFDNELQQLSFKCVNLLDNASSYDDETQISKVLDDVAYKLDGMIPASHFGKMLSNTFISLNEVKTNLKENILEYFTTKYPEVKDEIYKDYDLKNNPAIFNNWISNAIKDNNKEIPQWLKSTSDDDLKRILHSKGFNNKKFFKFLNQLDTEELKTFSIYKGKILDSFKEWYLIEKKINPEKSQSNEFNFQAQEKTILKSNIEINLNPFYFTHNIKENKEKEAIEAYIKNNLGKINYNVISYSIDKSVLKVEMTIESTLTKEQLENSNGYSISVDSYNFNFYKDKIQKTLNSIHELMCVPEFIQFYKTFDAQKKFITSEMENEINDGVVYQRNLKEALKNKDILDKAMDKETYNEEVVQSPSQQFKL